VAFAVTSPLSRSLSGRPRRTSRRSRLRARLLLAVLTGCVLLSVVPVGVAPASAAPPTPAFGSSIDPMPAYEPQRVCDPVERPGVLAFRDLLLRTYGTTYMWTTRACSAGMTGSEHYEGRALDWARNVYDSGQAAHVGDLLRWLLATDQYGNRFAMARRLGVMYFIWNYKIYGAWDDYAPRAYTGSSPHTDHVHFSFGWAGANKQTSFWRSSSTATFPVLFSVDSRSSGVYAPASLTAGTTYVIAAKGSYTFSADGRRADAECSMHGPGGSWVVRPDRPGTPSSLVDLEAAGRTAWLPVSMHSSGCDSGHEYRTLVTPASTGRPLLRVLDPLLSDNSSSLLVKIWPAPSTSGYQALSAAPAPE
jgi:hypothetical protein